MLKFCHSLLLLALASVFAWSPHKVVAQALDGDFDGDKKIDKASWDESTGIWRITTAKGTLSVQWGTLGDIPVPADYDGDGITEIAVWRPKEGNWYIAPNKLPGTKQKGTGRVVQWGTSGDEPLPADYNRSRPGMEIAVYRESVGTCFISTQNRSWSQRGTAYIVNEVKNCGR